MKQFSPGTPLLPENHDQDIPSIPVWMFFVVGMG